MNKKRRLPAILAALLATLLLLFGPPLQEAQSQVAVGVQASLGTESELGLGARLLANLGGSNFEVVGSVDRFFPDSDLDWWDFNANLFYHFHLANAPRMVPYLGGGVNVTRLSNGNFEDSEAGLNLGGGLRFPGQVTPFVELRGVVSGADQIVLTGGILFGPTSFR